MLTKTFIVVILLVSVATLSEATIKLKIAVVNPSATMKQTTPVKYDLPKGIEPEHILDKGEMELGYDFDKGTYYVYQTVELEPSEKKVLVIELEDVWIIPDNEISFLKIHTAGLVEKLDGTEHWDIGVELSDRIEATLAEIVRNQARPALSAREKMNLYYENVMILEKTKEDIGMLENLAIDVGGIVEERVAVPETLAVSVSPGRGIGPWEVIEYKVGVSNPAEDRKQVASLKHHLPEEVTPRAVLDTDGLELGYDFNKECFYVFKDVELEPAEKKEFLVRMKDIWRVPEVEIEALKAHARNLLLLLEDSEYFEEGSKIVDKVFSNLDRINTSQNLKVPPPEHIAYYRENLGIFKTVKEDVALLEKMTSQAGSTPGVTVAKARKKEGGGREIKKPKGYRGIILIAKSIFKGKAPTPATTWKIIFTIIAFVAVVSAVFFALWRAQVIRERRRAEERRKEAEKPNV